MPSGDDRRNEIVSGISGNSVGWDVFARPGGGSAAGADARRVSCVPRAFMIWRIAARSWLRIAAWTSPSYGRAPGAAGAAKGGAAAYGGATGTDGAATGAPRPGGRPGGGPGGTAAGGGDRRPGGA